ncbi:uncharacterized protein EI90DRAFT_505669 [Cantharellus anzutake]|uniref:uncharacterized protein n=1 Tax=Cantharellus anzutake TaxID=1750568 RepID=UPI00190783C7|nr:uncharacterized protein EI90DRAFT_505669 [Cantharellus anzutake]KAF8334095.1 hypothetical protein EI90DRAFT_505669 [Cantharellus anzutake]
MARIKSQLEARFKMVDAGPASWVVGMRVTNDPVKGHVTLDQSQYTSPRSLRSLAWWVASRHPHRSPRD